MPVMDNLRLLTRVQISGAAGVCVGRIEDIRSIDDLPDVPGADAAVPVAILREWGVTRWAVVSYFATPDQEVAFVALEINGEWFDLQKQRLTFEVIGQRCASWPH